MKAVNALKEWRPSRSTTIGMPSSSHRSDAVATKRTRGWAGVIWRDLR